MVNYFLLKARVRQGGLALVVALLIMIGFLAGYEIPEYFQFRQEIDKELYIVKGGNFCRLFIPALPWL